jgi:hypothetical protein
MTIGNNSNQKRNLDVSSRKKFLSIALLSVLVIASALLFFASPGKHTLAAAAPFTFTFAGDYAQTTHTTANLQYLQQQYASHSISFNIGLGDFNYASNVSAGQWSKNYLHKYLSTTFPFEIVAGRHDTNQLPTYEADLPSNNIAAITGKYGQEYYFDYPAGAPPLARFIMISPNQTIPGYSYNYNQGGADYNWVSSTIDAARAAGIHWIIVGMHQYCFVVGTSSCTNVQLLDMLLIKHVDVILEGQKHNYQRSKQLALDTGCPVLSSTSYDSACVVNTTTPNNLNRGAGTIITLSGTGGASPQLAINTSDPKFAYFQSTMPANNVTWGVSRFTVSATQLSEQFVPTSGGNFTDGYTITG